MAHNIQSSTNAVVPGPKPKRRGVLPWIFIILAVLVTGALIFGAVWGYKAWRNRTVVICAATEDGLATQAAAVLNADQTAELKGVVEKIQGTKNYQKDPNCLYPVVEYYVYTTNQSEAEKYYQMLQAVYNPEIGFNDAYVGQALNMEQIQAQIDSLTTINENIKSNTKFFN